MDLSKGVVKYLKYSLMNSGHIDGVKNTQLCRLFSKNVHIV